MPEVQRTKLDVIQARAKNLLRDLSEEDGIASAIESLIDDAYDAGVAAEFERVTAWRRAEQERKEDPQQTLKRAADFIREHSGEYSLQGLVAGVLSIRASNKHAAKLGKDPKRYKPAKEVAEKLNAMIDRVEGGSKTPGELCVVSQLFQSLSLSIEFEKSDKFISP